MPSSNNNNILYRDSSRFSLFAKSRFVVTTEEKRSEGTCLAQYYRREVQPDRRDNSNLMCSLRVPTLAIMKQHVREGKTYLLLVFFFSDHQQQQFLQSSVRLVWYARLHQEWRLGTIIIGWSATDRRQQQQPREVLMVWSGSISFFHGRCRRWDGKMENLDSVNGISHSQRNPKRTWKRRFSAVLSAAE